MLAMRDKLSFLIYLKLRGGGEKLLYGGFFLRLTPVRRWVWQLRGIVGSAQPHSSEKLIQNFLSAGKSLLFVLDISPTRWDNARRTRNFVGSEAFGVSTARSKKVAPTLYQFIYKQIRSHGTLHWTPFSNYSFADDNGKVLARRPLNWKVSCDK